MKRKKQYSLMAFLLCAALLTGIFAACSSSRGSAPGMNGAASTAARAAAPAGPLTSSAALALGTADAAASGAPEAKLSAAQGTAQGTAQAALSSQKIIEQLNYQIETLKFDESVGRIQSLCSGLGGYVQDSNMTTGGILHKNSLRTASYTLRIPQQKLGQLKSQAGQIGSILSFTSSSQNISERYYDTEARLKSLRTQQERLLALLQKSGSLADVLKLEDALEKVNYQIEQYTTTMKQYDSLIDYSTVSIQLNEVVQSTSIEPVPTTLWEKISQQFRQSVRGLGNFGEGLLVFFMGGSPVILLLVLIAVGLYWLLWGRKKHAQKKTMRAESSAKTENEDDSNKQA